MSGGGIKQDEREMAAMALRGDSLPRTQRAYRIAEKWCDRGWWDYGTAMLSGWVTDEGREGLARIADGGDVWPRQAKVVR